MQTTQEKLDIMDAKIDLLLSVAQKQAQLEDDESPINRQFINRRTKFLFIATIAPAIFAVLAYFFFIPLFSLLFGILILFVGLDLLIIMDEYVLPGQTIKKISQSGIGSAVLLLGFVILIWIGISVGNSLITARVPSEDDKPTVEYVQPQSQPASENNIQNSSSGQPSTNTESQSTEN